MHNLVQWFIPGPIDVRPEVLSAMSVMPYGHRTKVMKEKIASISENMLQFLQADKQLYTVLLFGGSGTNSLEAAARSFAEPSDDKKVLFASIGYFGDLWADNIFRGCGVGVEKLRAGDGEVINVQELEKRIETANPEIIALTHNETSTGATNPLKEIANVVGNYKKAHENALFLVDAVSSLGGVPIYPQELGIDYLVTSPQKCLGVPPGLGIALISENAVRKAGMVKNKGYTTNVLEYVKAAKKNETLTTPPQAQIEALYVQLEYILNRETPQGRFERHRQLAELTRNWAKKEGFGLLPDERYASDTVSCFVNERLIKLDELKKSLYEKGYGFDPGYRKLNDVREKQKLPPTFRIAHMGDRTLEQLGKYLDTLSKEIRQQQAL